MFLHSFFPAGQTTASTTAKRRLCNVKFADRIALILVIVGALNWGSVGLFGFDCVAFLFGGQMATVSRIVYSLVGLAGLWCVTLLFRERDGE